jgi:hypothetical protein
MRWQPSLATRHPAFSNQLDGAIGSAVCQSSLQLELAKAADKAQGPHDGYCAEEPLKAASISATGADR